MPLSDKLIGAMSHSWEEPKNGWRRIHPLFSFSVKIAGFYGIFDFTAIVMDSLLFFKFYVTSFQQFTGILDAAFKNHVFVVDGLFNT
jgi:hypothetical protein